MQVLEGVVEMPLRVLSFRMLAGKQQTVGISRRDLGAAESIILVGRGLEVSEKAVTINFSSVSKVVVNLFHIVSDNVSSFLVGSVL